MQFQVKSLLQISSAIVDVVDIQNSAVAICLEDGWDATAQVETTKNMTVQF